MELSVGYRSNGQLIGRAHRNITAAERNIVLITPSVYTYVIIKVGNVLLYRA